MRVEREDHLALEAACQLGDARDNLPGLRGPERAVHEVVLHVNDYQVPHGFLPFRCFSQYGRRARGRVAVGARLR